MHDEKIKKIERAQERRKAFASERKSSLHLPSPACARGKVHVGCHASQEPIELMEKGRPPGQATVKSYT